MKKLCAALLAAVMLFSLCACGEKSQEENTNNENLREYDAFMAEFKSLLSELPEYTVTQLRDVDLDEGAICHVYAIDDTLTDKSYRLRIDTDKENKITGAQLSSERETYGNIQFAVFAAYTYSSMGFEIEDSDAFYEKYDLLSKEKIYESYTIGDYGVSSMTIDVTNEITFSITTEE